MPLPNEPIMELALLEVKPGREQEFEAAFGSAQQIISGMLSLMRAAGSPVPYSTFWPLIGRHPEVSDL